MKLLKTILSLSLMIVLLQESQWLEFIKQHEGLRLTPYTDIFGNKTIYYGHLISDKDRYNYPKDSAYAEIILKQDFNKRKILVKKLYPNWEEHRILAITHFVYAKGVGNYMKSKLRLAIESNRPPNEIHKEWMQWAIVKGKISYKSLYNRNLEYNTFFYGVEPRWYKEN